MSMTVKSAYLATQLRLFQPPRTDLRWAAMPLEYREQVEHLLARMLRDHARRQLERARAREARDE